MGIEQQQVVDDARESNKQHIEAVKLTVDEAQRETAKLKREQQKRERQFDQWDKLFAVPLFHEYLTERGVVVTHKYRERYKNAETEAVVIGAMLMEIQAVKEACRLLHFRSFEVDKHQRIFYCIAAQMQGHQTKGTPIDLITTVDELRSRDWLQKVGGVAYLTACVEACPSARNIAAYCEIVAQAAQRRALQACGDFLAEAVTTVGGKRWNAATTLKDDEPLYPPERLTKALRLMADQVDAIPRAGAVPDFKNLLSSK